MEAASNWKTFENRFGTCGFANNQSGINSILKKGYPGLYVKDLETVQSLKVPDGNYKGMRFWFNAPDSTLTNNGTFKVIKIMQANVWNERGIGNSFSVVDDVKFNVKADAEVARLYVKKEGVKVNVIVAENATLKKFGAYEKGVQANITLSKGANLNAVNMVSDKGELNVVVPEGSKTGTVKVNGDGVEANIVVDGTVKQILVAKPNTNVVLEGDAKEVVVKTTAEAQDTIITASVPVKVQADNNVELHLKKGSEGTTVTKTGEKVEVGVKNESKETVEIKTEGSTETEKVESGDSTVKEETGDGGSTDDKKEETGDKEDGSGTTPTPTPNPSPAPNPGPAPDPDLSKTPLAGVTISPAAVEVGTTLEAKASPDGADADYTWYHGDDRADYIGTGKTYQIKESDRGHKISVVAAGTGEYDGTKEVTTATAVPNPISKVIIRGDGLTGDTTVITTAGSVKLTASTEAKNPGAAATEEFDANSLTWSIINGSGIATLSAISGSSTEVKSLNDATGTAVVQASYKSVTAANFTVIINDGATVELVTVIFNYNGQSKTVSVVSGGSLREDQIPTDSAVKKDGVIFKGWAESANETNVDNISLSAVLQSKTLTAGVTYYAIYAEELKVSISVEGSGSTDGEVATGAVLKASVVPAGATVTYQWMRDGSDISNATGASYTVADADAGKAIRVEVTGTGLYTGQVVSSDAITVQAAPKAEELEVAITSGGAVVSGEVPTGTALSAAVTPASVANANKVSYQWYVSGSAVTAATGSNYTVRDEDAGGAIYVTVTGTETPYDGKVATSASINVKAADSSGEEEPPEPEPKPVTLSSVQITSGSAANAPTVSTVAVGTELSAKISLKGASSITTPDAIAYTWYTKDADGTNTAIANAKAATYKAVAADLGKQIFVTVSGDGIDYIAADGGVLTSAAVTIAAIAVSSSAVSADAITTIEVISGDAVTLDLVATPSVVGAEAEWKLTSGAGVTAVTFGAATADSENAVAPDNNVYTATGASVTLTCTGEAGNTMTLVVTYADYNCTVKYTIKIIAKSEAD